MRRTLIGVIMIVVVVVVGLVAAGAIGLIRQNEAGGDAAPGGAVAPSASGGAGIPPRPEAAFPLTVRYVYDGDTIQAQMQTSNDVVTTGSPIRIRIIGIDTPEGAGPAECWASEAREHLATLLPEGSTVWAAPDRDTWDDYQRRLFNLWTDDGRFVAHELVAAGDAEAIRVWPNVAFSDMLAKTQKQAQSAGAGQWGACR